MTTVPNTIWDPLGKQTEPRMASQDICCVHTMAGTLEGVRAMFKRDGYGGTESHLGIGGSGKTYQWQDLEYQADANLDGNPVVISIETADKGESFPSWSNVVPPWTEDQIDKLVEVLTWICQRYDIPPVLIPDTKPGRRGLAYHRQGIDGNFYPPQYQYPGRVAGGVRWSGSSGKICPGDNRIKQFIEIVIPRVQRNVSPSQDFDWIVIATKGDQRDRERFERMGVKFMRHIRKKLRRGWQLTIRRVIDQ